MDDVEKVIKYILLIAPGFLVLAICGYLIEWVPPEPHVYVPAAVMFSVLIYAVTYYLFRVAHAMYWSLWQSGETAPQWTLHLPSFILATVALSLVIGAAFSMLYVSDGFVRIVRGYSDSFDMVSFETKSEPLYFVLANVSFARAIRLDGRPTIKDSKGTALVRLRLGEGEYVEGHPMYYPKKEDGYIYLSYACFVSVTEGKETSKVIPPPSLEYRPIAGPGILVHLKDAPVIEVLDLKTSGCTIRYCKDPTIWKQAPVCEGVDTGR